MTGTWLSQDAFDRLQLELAELEGPRRADIVKKIAAAREEGDLKENGGYHAAREEQGKLEGRIRQLKHMLEHAHVGINPNAEEGKVALGMVVTVDMAGEEMTFLLGSREGAPENLDVFSEKSPLGAAVLGGEIGATVNYSSPDGKRSFSVVVLEAEPYQG